MGRNTIDGRGIDHSGQSACLEALLERAEIFLPQIIKGNISRSAVLTRMRDTITQEVLDADSGVLKVDMVGIVSLDRLCLGTGHLRLKIGVLPPTLPMPRPAGITTEIHDRREYPCHLSGPGLISESLAHHSGIFPVESGSQVDFLRVKGSVSEIRSPVDHVQAIDARDSDQFH